MARETVLKPDDDDALGDDTLVEPSFAPEVRAGLISKRDDEREDDRDLRPQRIRDMIGQREVIERLDIALDAARKRGETLGHILFDGPPGLGKTTFAMAIPRELGVTFQIASAAALSARPK